MPWSAIIVAALVLAIPIIGLLAVILSDYDSSRRAR